MKHLTRRQFLQSSGSLAGLACFDLPMAGKIFDDTIADVPVSGHLWVYASRFPPNWDATPVLDQVFSDFQYAGMQGVEVMESILRHEDVVPRVSELVEQYGVPVTGTSYTADMWDKSKHQEILEDIELVIERLHQLKGSTFGITVGDAGRKKTEQELDAQGEILQKVLAICQKNSVQANLHNHTFEVVNNLHDLKGTMDRVPELKLGPDINWLIRGGVDPVEFIETYGHKMVYLHIRDQYANGKWTEAVGEGATDFPAIAQALKKVNFNGRAAIELAFDAPPVNPVRESWKKSRDYVRKVFEW